MSLTTKIKKFIKKINEMRTIKGWKLGIILKKEKKEDFFHRKGVDNE